MPNLSTPATDPDLLAFTLSAVDRMAPADLAQVFATSAVALDAQGGAIALSRALDIIEQRNPATCNELADAVFMQAREGGVS